MAWPFSKPLSEISIADINLLIAEETPEGLHLEFKETLPARRGAIDPWILGKGKIGDHARDRILEEVTAFANAYGGTLLLGVAEADTVPHVATGFFPISSCHDLVQRLKLVFRDCIEPPLPHLSFKALPTEGESGIVIIQVGQSPLGPHRVVPTLKCPVRRFDRCEAMSMREIHDLTLSLSRNLDRIEKTLSDRSRSFKKEFRRLETPDEAFGFRCTAIPIGHELTLRRVYENGNIIPAFSWPHAKVYREVDEQQFELKSFESIHGLGPANWRPILRGARCDSEHGTIPEVQRRVYWEIHCSGLLECGFLSNNSISNMAGVKRINVSIHPEVVVSTFAQISGWSDRLRENSADPGAEYAIQFEVAALGTEAIVQRDASVWSMALGSIGVGNTVFPTYTGSAFKQAGELLEFFENDFFNYIGRELSENQGKLRFAR